MNKTQKLVQEQFLNNEEAVIRRLKSVYNQSLKDITEKTKELQAQIEAFDALEGIATDPEELARIKSMKQSKVYQKQYQEALKKQVNAILDNMQTEEFKTVDSYLKKCYEDGFVGTMYDLHNQGIPLIMPLDQTAMVRAVQLDSKISQGLYTRLGEDVTLLKKKITATVSRSISTGISYQQAAKQLASYTNIGYNNAVRIARTEGHRIQVQSSMDACEKAKEKGADVVKQWDATLDANTRESHQAVDGEIRELDKPFSNGLMFPGDPSGGASEVVNCRCALLQRAKWALDDDELQTLKERAEFFGIDKSESFSDFKSKYLKAANSGDKIIVEDADDWKSSKAGKTFKSKKESFDYFESKGIKIYDSRKYPMDEQLAIEIGQWHSKFTEIFSKFDSSIINKLPDIKNVAPSSLPNGVFGRFSYYLSGEVIDIKLNSWLHNTLNFAKEKSSISFERGWHSGKSPIHTFVHEYGHYVAHSMNGLERGFEHNIISETVAEYKKTHPEYTLNTYSGAKDALSKYGTTNESECFAECFAEYFGEEEPREFATIFGKKLEEALKGVKNDWRTKRD